MIDLRYYSFCVPYFVRRMRLLFHHPQNFNVQEHLGSHKSDLVIVDAVLLLLLGRGKPVSPVAPAAPALWEPCSDAAPRANAIQHRRGAAGLHHYSFV